jgi:hypothetical protein
MAAEYSKDAVFNAGESIRRVLKAKHLPHLQIICTISLFYKKDIKN